MLYDVIVVGAGPGGSSAAAFLAQHGLSVLLLDKADFPREKVCGDGLTPQAIYWLDRLGCVEEVLNETSSCITSADIYVDGEHVLTGRFPQDTIYPGFCTLLTRKKLDSILVRHAVSRGARFRPGHHVRKLHWHPDNIKVQAEAKNRTVTFSARLLIGADGANSVISRTLGNVPRAGTTAVSVRTYYDGVKVDRSPFKLYFDKMFFPGYGWVFVDDNGRANIGLGYASDKNFSMRPNLKVALHRFVRSRLKDMLAEATPAGRPAGWWLSFSRPRAIAADRVMLIGDAANLADPLTGGGIHKAIESAYRASQVAAYALSRGDCSPQTLSLYEKAWSEQAELDWRISELLISIAKNPNLKELYLYFLKAMGRLSQEDPRFQDFCVGVFVELTARSACLSPLVLLSVMPLDPGAWLSIIRASNGAGSENPVNLASSATRSSLQMALRLLRNPLENLDWGLENASKVVKLLDCYASDGVLQGV